MPLVHIESVKEVVQLGIWKIETADTYSMPYTLRNRVQKEVSLFKNEVRRQERLSVYELLYLLTHNENIHLKHTPSGKPQLNGYNISISHTKEYAVVILSDTTMQVAVDIEFMNERIHRIAHRIFRPDEPFASTPERILAWTVKETIYKLYSEDKLLPEEVKVHFLPIADVGEITAENLRRNEQICLNYSITTQYVLTYTYQSSV